MLAGFDRTYYNGQDPQTTGGVPVVDIHGVFAGFSAADFVAPPRSVADLGYGLYGKSSTVVPAKFRDMMIPKSGGYWRWPSFYGLGTMNVGLMGIAGKDVKAYGHLGATYGYDSIYAYAPELDISIAVATNIETMDQTQPADALAWRST